MTKLKKLNTASVRNILKNKYGKDNVFAMHGLKIRGVADVLMSIDGYPFFLEIKIDRDVVSATQILFLKTFHRSSGVLHVFNEEKGPRLVFIGSNKFPKNFTKDLL